MNIFKILLILSLLLIQNCFSMSPSISDTKLQKKERKMIVSRSLDFRNSTEPDYSSPTLSPITIGGGGSGQIITRRNSRFVEKKSNSSSAIQMIEREFKIQQKIYLAVQEYTQNFMPNLRDNIKIPEPIYEAETDGSQEESFSKKIGMERVFSIEGSEEILTGISLGREQYNIYEKYSDLNIKKGHILGYKEIIKKLKEFEPFEIPNTKINSINGLNYYLGSLIAIVHYKAKYDGLDTEIFLTRENETEKNIKVTMLDFGLCRNISKNLMKNPTKAYEKIVYTMTNTNEMFFPNPNKKSFKYFLQGYYEVADSLGFLEIAETVIKKFIIKQFILKIVYPEYLLKYENIKPLFVLRKSLKSYNKIEPIENDLFSYIEKNRFNVNIKQMLRYLRKLHKSKCF
jgi:hypothetical protein